jgi:hypothetical protein
MSKLTFFGKAESVEEIESVLAETEQVLRENKRKQRFGGKLTPGAIADIWARWRGEGVYARKLKGTLKK